MKMFLTRMGRNSRAVVTGDITQIDLERRENSGFVFVLGLLKDLDPGVRVVELRESDVMRNPIVQRIINAYDRYERERSQKRGDEEQ
jgi:phosphate starvation-inducible PhoH-like protein